MNFPSAWCQFAARKTIKPVICLLGSLGFASIACADFQLNFVYSPITGATTATFTGSWGAWGGTNDPSPVNLGSINPTGIADFSGTNDLLSNSAFSGAIIPWSVNTTSSGHTGASWGFGPSIIYAPSGYVANTVISGTVTFAGLDLTALGFDATEIANGGTIGSGNFIVHWTASSPIPEPATDAVCLGLVALGAVAWRIRRGVRKV